MNKKPFSIVGVLIILIAGIWYFYSRSTPTPPTIGNTNADPYYTGSTTYECGDGAQITLWPSTDKTSITVEAEFGDGPDSVLLRKSTSKYEGDGLTLVYGPDATTITYTWVNGITESCKSIK